MTANPPETINAIPLAHTGMDTPLIETSHPWMTRINWRIETNEKTAIEITVNGFMFESPFYRVTADTGV
jgi:hypothetical protein